MTSATSWRWRAGASVVWRASVLALAAAAAAALAGWFLSTAADQRGAVGLLAAACSVPVIGAALGLLRVREVDLRLDAQGWQLAEAGGEPRSVAVEVAVDLGWAMLLRTRGDHGPARWLSVDRRALGPLWPALRRGVYSPRPAGSPPASADRPDPTA